MWRFLKWKSAAGGWWNLALGKRPPARVQQYNAGKLNGEQEGINIEDRINALAEVLGLHSHELASAIADAVRSHVLPEALRSVAAAETTKSRAILEGVMGEEGA